jgi:hypothetical protein
VVEFFTVPVRVWAAARVERRRARAIRRVASRLLRRKELVAARGLPQVLRETKTVSLRMTGDFKIRDPFMA